METMKKYSIKLCIGRGNFGDVYMAEARDSLEVVAIKVINLDASDEDVSVTVLEIQLLSRLRSKYITKYHEAFVSNMSLWIVMEYCGGGSCSDLLKCHKRVSEDVAGYIIRSAMLGLQYLHAQRKVHRDIKSANILLTNSGEVKLADFGVSGEMTMTQLKKHTFVGTPFWMAPEVIKRRNSGYDEKADIWSIGITAIELVTGTPPLSEYDPMKILFEIPNNEPPTLEHHLSLSINIKDFVKYCLKKDPTERPTAKLLLSHRFLKARRSLTLVQLIQKRNKWMSDKYANGRKPKHALEEAKADAASIQWDFNSAKSFRLGAKTSEVSPLSSSLPKSNIMSASVLSTPQSQSPVAISATGLNSRNYLEDVVIFCLGRVAQRAKTAETKRAVEAMARHFVAYEASQPGMCEAIVEEICLHVNELVATNQ